MRDAALVRYRGLMQEKFIERALKENIRILSAERKENHVTLIGVHENDLHALLDLGEKLSLDIKLISHSASGKAAKFARRRLSLIPALMLCVALLIFAASRVWLIELRVDDSVTGGEVVMEAERQALLNGLTKLGISPGISLSAADTDELALMLQQKAPDYSFIGVRVTGVRLLIEAVREFPAPELYDLDGARDLVASCDAIIVSVDAMTGVSQVKPGDTVRRGQVLISGEEKLTDEATHGVSALGTVVARCWITGEAEAYAYATERLYTGRESAQSVLRLMDLSYPLLSGESYENEEIETIRHPIGGLFLPLHIEKTTRREVEERVVSGNLSKIQENIRLLAFEMAEEKLPEMCVIVDKWIDYSMIEGDKIHARAVIEIERNIAVSRQALHDGGM